MHDTTSSENGEEEGDNEGDGVLEDGGDDGREGAALEEDEEPAAHLDTGDEDWGSGSYQTGTSMGTADNGEGAEGQKL